MKHLKKYSENVSENISDKEYDMFYRDILGNLDSMTPNQVGDINKSLDGTIHNKNKLYKTHNKFKSDTNDLNDKIYKRKQTIKMLNKLKSNDMLSNDKNLDLIFNFAENLTKKLIKK